jgi:hypothetical protein
MNLALAEFELPVRLRFEHALTDAELLHFCEANEAVRVEREANGEILVMTPAGFGSSNMRAVAIYRPGDSPEVLHEPTSVQGTAR